ncbi:reverse transcriptase [Gossypium australe]|uniref:Reverse transcriptase n=1 Tax=Gossypium australe TaxID=47621 RepID=A0A5B6VD99_9ROSI|nr:reverse transcriptase [Gossypium australe]
MGWRVGRGTGIRLTLHKRFCKFRWRKIQERTFRYGRKSFLANSRSEVLINYYKMLAWILVTY